MADPISPDAARRPRRRLDGRTLAICACLAVIGAIVAALVATWILAEDDQPDGFSLKPAGELLEERVTTIEGRTTAFGSLLRDQPVLVNFWQQSCVPCVEEMPLLEEAAQANPQIDVLGIDVQDRLSHAKEMAKQTGITYPWVQDPDGTFFAAAGASGLPTTILLDPTGEVLATKNGVFDDLAEIQSFIDDHVS